LLDKNVGKYTMKQRTADVLNNIYNQYTLPSRKMMDEVPKVEDYTNAHKTILKKYSDFPK
jgi:phage-related protein